MKKVFELNYKIWKEEKLIFFQIVAKKVQMKRGFILLMVLFCTYMTWGEKTVVSNDVFRPDRIFVESPALTILPGYFVATVNEK